MDKINYNTDQLSSAKRRAQLKSLDDAARQVLAGSFARHQASDRLLAAYFRNNHRCGSRDRALISECIYAMLRYWGYLRKYLPQNRREDIESGAIKLTSQELGALLCSGCFAAGLFEYAETLRDNWRLNQLPKPASTPERRARQMAEYFNVSETVNINDLLPEWVAEYLPEDLDRDKFLEGLSERPPMWLRLQTISASDTEAVLQELAAAGAETDLNFIGKKSLKVRAKVNLFTFESYKSGKFEIQDLASQCIGLVCGAARGERWLDACAGAGGKSLQLADMMERKGTVTAGDLRAYKLEDLRRRARRAGFPNIVTKDNPASLRRPKHPFDGVLVDAPCSCSGVWRRNPGAQWKLTAQEIDELAAQQLQILTEYAGAVRAGGTLVYATCSMFDKENREVVRKFLDANPEFKLDPFAHPFDEEKVCPGMLRVDGDEFDCDTMFVAKMRKVN